MASTKLSIHVVPEANPETVLALVNELGSDNDLEFESFNELLSHMAEKGIGAYRTELTKTASDMEILTSSPPIRLGHIGQILAKIREEARGELLHFLMYTGWLENDPTGFLQSWAYKLCCNQYWDQGQVTLTSDYRNRQISEIIDIATQTFSELDVGDFDEISFSGKSLSGVYKWLGGLNPPVIEENTFSLRTFCQPELAIMAVGYVLRDDPELKNIDVLLTPEKREAICRLCMLSPESLDRVLDWAIPIFPNVIEPGTTAGFYGRFVRLQKLPTLEDIVR